MQRRVQHHRTRVSLIGAAISSTLNLERRDEVLALERSAWMGMKMDVATLADILSVDRSHIRRISGCAVGY